MQKLDIHHLSKKDKIRIRTWTRIAIQVLFFVLFPSAFTAAFNGAKYLFLQVGASEKIEITSFGATLIGLCIFTIIFGRFFCGFACAFGSLGDWVRAIYLKICKKLKKKPIKINEKIAEVLSYMKYFILALILVMNYLGAYGKFQGTSPWDVFSMLHAGNFKLEKYVIGSAILFLIVIGMCVQERFFCRFLCPMGAIFSMLPVLPFFSLRRDREACAKGCSACGKNCPANIGLPQDGTLSVSGDCFQCQKCIGICPKTNIHCGIKKLRGNEYWFTALRVLVLVGVYLWLGL